MNVTSPDRSAAAAGDAIVWIVLVDYNGLPDTRKCLTSLADLASPARVVVVDNAGRTDVGGALSAEFPWAVFVRSPVNGGWAGGNNVGLRYALSAGAEWVILLNNDTVVPPHFVRRMLEAAARHPAFGVLGPVIMEMDQPDVVQTTGVVFNRPNRPGFFQRVPVPCDPDGPAGVVECDIVNGCCLMLHRDVAAAVGLVDERFFLIHEESDWCLRAQRVTKLGVVTDGLVFHKGSSTFKREGSKVQRYFDTRNIPRLLWKHRRRRVGRSLPTGLVLYLVYAYHRYSLEREADRPTGAAAVLEGLYDGLTGRYGGRRDGWRPGLSVLSALFGLTWRLRSRGRRPAVPPPATTDSP